MNTGGFESISRVFAERKLSRRQDADAEAKTEYLFVQSFRAGSIAAKDGAEGEYTVTLEGGLGQTLFFSDRPARVAGVAPTPRFLDGLGFTPENPPNAALVISNDAGETDIAVVELMNPVYDEATASATYDIKVLENFDGIDMQVGETALDLSAIASPFGSAHLLIDDCHDQELWCRHLDHDGRHYEVTDPYLGVHGMCWDPMDLYCYPCPDVGLVNKCWNDYPAYCNHTTECEVWT